MSISNIKSLFELKRSTGADDTTKKPVPPPPAAAKKATSVPPISIKDEDEDQKGLFGGLFAAK